MAHYSCWSALLTGQVLRLKPLKGIHRLIDVGQSIEHQPELFEGNGFHPEPQTGREVRLQVVADREETHPRLLGLTFGPTPAGRVAVAPAHPRSRLSFPNCPIRLRKLLVSPTYRTSGAVGPMTCGASADHAKQ